MARRRRYGHKRKGGRRSKAFPLLLMAPVIPGFMAAYDNRASPKEAVRQGVFKISGVDITGQAPISMENVGKTLGLAVVGIVGHKVAGRVGINRWIKKATLGYIQL